MKIITDLSDAIEILSKKYKQMSHYESYRYEQAMLSDSLKISIREYASYDRPDYTHFMTVSSEIAEKVCTWINCNDSYKKVSAKEHIIDKDKKYAVITTIQTFRYRYVVEMKNTDYDPIPYKDYVVSDDVEEFSQLHLGEVITDATTMNREQVVEQFDKDHIESDSKIFLEWSDELKMQNAHKPED